MSLYYSEQQIDLAKAIAYIAHAGQFRRDGTTAYIEHPKAVVNHLQGTYSAWQVTTTAWLHDVIEDNRWVTADTLIELGVDVEVVNAVQLLTKCKGEAYVDYIKRIAGNAIARRVKIADIECNLADAPTDEQRSKYKIALEILEQS